MIDAVVRECYDFFSTKRNYMTKKKTIKITGGRGKKFVQFPFFITREDRADIMKRRVRHILKLRRRQTLIEGGGTSATDGANHEK
ncbi:MAG: hypothetical protein PHS37_05350 [Candidatus Omnitrophica bacterium]|nr:hypothetical protein [Candidatus Omnitrophota bacterium]